MVLKVGSLAKQTRLPALDDAVEPNSDIAGAAWAEGIPREDSGESLIVGNTCGRHNHGNCA